MTISRCVAVGAWCLFSLAGRAHAAEAAPVDVTSPDRQVVFSLSRDASDGLRYAVTFRGVPVIVPSRLGLMLDDVPLAREAVIGDVVRSARNETYPTRGVHATARDHANTATIALSSPPASAGGASQAYTLEVRAFNDGVGFRWRVPAAPDARARVPDAGTDFRLPVGSSVWYHDLAGHYEGIFAKRRIAPSNDRRGEVPLPRAGEWASVPLVAQLPAGAGYAFISEAGLSGYAGMALQIGTEGLFRERLGHAHPPSYPYALRYGLDEVDRLARPAAITGEIVTPWRVIAVAADLNGLVNTDIITNLAPPPDKTLFPEGQATAWIKPGRALWRYLDGGEATLEGQKEFARLAGQLGFEHNVIEGFWRRWSKDEMRELVAYSREQGVGLWFWMHSRDLRTPEERETFFSLLAEVGVVGAKIDFLDHEAKETVDLYQELLRAAAKHRIMVNFHGANKSAGEPRTWPNELTREAIYGLEHRSIPAWAELNTTLPFTRFLVGPADYTPVMLTDRRKDTSWTHQLATAAVFTSPLMIYAANPQRLLDNPAVELIKTLPSTWDETIVLPGSAIGEVAAYARRRGKVWFVAVLNGTEARTLEVALPFLKDGRYTALAFADVESDSGAMTRSEKVVTPADTMTVAMRAGGGYIARLTPLE